jgi:hypothetical protein
MNNFHFQNKSTRDETQKKVDQILGALDTVCEFGRLYTRFGPLLTMPLSLSLTAQPSFNNLSDGSVNFGAGDTNDDIR